MFSALLSLFWSPVGFTLPTLYGLSLVLFPLGLYREGGLAMEWFPSSQAWCPSSLVWFLDRIQGFMVIVICFIATYCVPCAIYAELPSVHYYLTGLAVVMGFSMFGTEGILIGPLVIVVPILVFLGLGKEGKQVDRQRQKQQVQRRPTLCGDPSSLQSVRHENE